MSDLNILFSPEDLLAHKNKPPQLPLHGGRKAFAPDDSSEQDDTLTSLLQEQRDILQEQRVAKKGNLSIGTWNPDDQVAEITVTKGHHWQHFGQNKHGKMVLQPHEALFLLEQGSLQLFYSGLPMSFQQAYMSMLSDDFTPDHYLVYTYFLRLGFIVLQHSSRQKGKENMKTENKNQPEKKQKEEAATTTAAAAAADDDGIVSDADDADQPMTSSPVAHLWTSEDGCRPLVRPEDATSTASVLSKLQVIKNQRMTEADCMELSPAEPSLQVDFDVYQPGLNFKKTDPGSPDFCITVCRFCDPPPSLGVLTVLRKECSPIPHRIALVDGGSISFYSVLDVDSPTFIMRG
ncbi:uncharacterized protein LOC144632172 [Oculina patagonica]